MNVFTKWYNFFFKKKITEEHVVPECLGDTVIEVAKPELQVLRIKAPKQRSMSWVEARSLVMGGKMDSTKDN